MGGHGGLNILPQKRWNVYNYENREKVRLDEEAAAREEQLKREQSRKRDAEFRLEKLRVARGLAPASQTSASTEPASTEPKSQTSASTEPELESSHINLFEGLKFFDTLGGAREDGKDVKSDGFKNKKMKKEEVAPKVVTAEDEKYRLGYGLAGKGVKVPWYLAKPSDGLKDESAGDNDTSRLGKEGGKSSGKKTLEELREERLRREKREKERERALVLEKSRRDGAVAKDRRFSRRI